MNNWKFGRMCFEDGHRPVLLHRHRKNALQAFFLDGSEVKKRLVTEPELKYFTQWADDARTIKRVIRKFMGKNLLSGRRREMSGIIRRSLKQGLEL